MSGASASSAVTVKKRDHYKNAPEGHVYIIGQFSQTLYVKIGITRDIDKRLATFNGYACSLPDDFYVIYGIACEDPYQTERYLHGFFDQYRLSPRKEWFAAEIVSRVIDAMEALPGIIEEYDRSLGSLYTEFEY